MPTPSNSFRQQENPAPKYLNDPTGFWEANAASSKRKWSAILPSGAVIEMDRRTAQEILRKSISWLSVVVRWGRTQFRASLDDTRAGAPLEAGGLGATGAITLVFLKSLFPTGKRPLHHDTFDLLVNGAWKKFQIAGISESFDETDDAMICFLEPEDSSQ